MAPYGTVTMLRRLGIALVLVALAPGHGAAAERMLACTACAAPALVGEAHRLGSALTPVRLDKCVRVSKVDGRDTLINRCRVCRRVTLRRHRPGGAATVHRTYTLLAKSYQTLSFRGPGQSRITSDIPCKDAVDLDRSRRKQPKQCVALRQVRGRGPTILNLCRACRVVVLERIRSGSGNTSQIYTIGAKAYIPVPLHGARQARIVSDKACP